MTLPSMPVATTASLAIHAGLFVLFLKTGPIVNQDQAKVINNVDLLIQVRKKALAPVAKPKAAPPPSMLNFLKMALPSAPKAAPQSLEVKLPERKKILMRDPDKLEDKGRRKAMQKVEALDLGSKRVEAARLDAMPAPSTRRTQALAQAPRLEEVGRRKVRDLPQALALEERRREAVSVQRMDALVPKPRSSRASAAAIDAPVLREATPVERRQLSKMTSLLPEPRARSGALEAAPEPLSRKMEVAPERRERQPAAAIQEEKKKSLEIEGPLADRRVVHFEVPPFPTWLRDLGVGEAATAIRFYVSPEGSVLSSGMSVERTSGYGRLDRLAMSFLQRWRFAPIGTQEKQWGIITFRFVTE